MRAARSKVSVFTLFAVFAFMTMSYARAQDLKSKFLDNFANAIVVSAKCKAWKVNPKMVMPVMAFFKITTADISPGGADWTFFSKTSRVRKKTSMDSTVTQYVMPLKACSGRMVSSHQTS